LGKLVEGAERYLEVTRLAIAGGDQAVQGKAQQEAARELEELTPKIPNLVIQIKGADEAKVSVTIDNQPVAAGLIGEKQPINPGKHVIRGQFGDQRQQAEVEITNGERSVTLTFQPDAAAPNDEAPADAPAVDAAAESAPPEPSSDKAPPPSSSGNPLRTVAWVSLGVGGAALIAGVVTGGVVLNWKNQIDSDPTLATNEVNRARYETWRKVAIGELAAGGALALIGGVLLIATRTNEAQVSLELGPTQASVRGTF
jgi:hypothetical protein